MSEIDWFSDPGTAVGQNIFPISPPDKVLIFLVGGLCCAFCSGVFSGQQRTQDLPVVTNKAITRSPPPPTPSRPLARLSPPRPTSRPLVFGGVTVLLFGRAVEV